MYCVDTTSYDQPQGLAWVVLTLVAEIPPLVRSSRTNATRVTHFAFQVFILLNSNGVYCFVFPSQEFVLKKSRFAQL